jgi:hypothetical protein
MCGDPARGVWRAELVVKCCGAWNRLGHCGCAATVGGRGLSFVIVGRGCLRAEESTATHSMPERLTALRSN